LGLRTDNLAYVRGAAPPRACCFRLGPGRAVVRGVPFSRFVPMREPRQGPAGRLWRRVAGGHGWVPGAGQAGSGVTGAGDTDGFALFVGEAEGRQSLGVPLDDGVRSPYYRPLTRYVLNRACLSQ
jgi:hypothetical protein